MTGYLCMYVAYCLACVCYVTRFCHILASLTEDNSAGFMTANYYSNDEPEPSAGSRVLSSDAAVMADTIAMQEEQITELVSENSRYKQKCSKLMHLIQHSGKTICQQLKQLKEMGQFVRQDVSSCSADLDTFRNKILLSVQSAPTLHRQQVDELLQEQIAINNANIEEVSKAYDKKTLEHSELLQTHEKLQLDYDKLVSQLDAREEERKVELATAVQTTEGTVTKRLMLEHEAEVDVIRSNAATKIQAAESKAEEGELETERLRLEAKKLLVRIDSDLVAVEGMLSKQRIEMEDVMQSRLAEVRSSHEKELEALSKKAECGWNERVDVALAEQREELQQAHASEIEVSGELIKCLLMSCSSAAVCNVFACGVAVAVCNLYVSTTLHIVHNNGCN